MAEKALALANGMSDTPGLDEKGVDNEWFQKWMRRVEKLKWRVPCSHCQAKINSPCKRPSEHPLYGNRSHEDRLARMDQWLSKQIRSADEM